MVVLHIVLYFLHNSCSFSCRLYGERHTCYFSAKTLLLSSSSSQPTESFHKGHAGTCAINVCVNTSLYAYSCHFHIWQMFQQTEFLSYECFKENKCDHNYQGSILLAFGEKYLLLQKCFCWATTSTNEFVMWWRLKAMCKQSMKLHQHIDQLNILKISEHVLYWD